MGLSYIKLFFDQIRALEPYSDEETGRLIRAMARYAEFGEEPAFAGNERFIWPMLKDAIARSSEKYEELCAVRKECGSKGGRPKKPKGFSENQMVIEKPKGFSENQKKQKNLREEEEQDQEEEPPPPTPSRGERINGSGGGSGDDFDDILLTDGNRQELSDFLSSGLTMEIVQHAVDEAAANGQKKWSYVRGILNRYKREGIQSVEQAKASDGRTGKTAAKPKTRKEKYICMLNGEAIEYEREVVIDDEYEKKRRNEARTLARLRGEMPE